MRGTTAWACSARAFEAAQSPDFPSLLRHACVWTGVICFWAALALEHRAFDVWREQKAQRRRFGRRPRRWTERMKEWLGWREQCLTVTAWSLPDSPKIRGLGLGQMWAVLCPFCDEFHTHSPGEGGRMPHCCSERDRRRYVLEFAGSLPMEHRTRFYRSSKSGLPRLLHHWPETGVHRGEAMGLLAA